MTRRRKAPSWPTTPRRRARRPAASRLEFRSPVDGAWYSVRLARQGEALRVMYEEFAEEHDEWYEPRQLAGAHELSDIRARFRLPSMQLEDSRCRTVRPGAALCVSCAFDGGELKFYDAVLESVSSSAHETVDGEERCNCRFLVRWKERPLARSRSEVGIEQVCCVQFSPVQDPILSEFLGRASSLIRKQGIMASHSVSSTTSEHQEGSCSAAASTCPGPGSGGCGRGQRGGGAGEVVEQGRVPDAGDSGGGGAGATDGGVKDAVLPDDGVKLPSGAGAACPALQQRCRHCKTELTPQWPGTLCNACGVRYMTGRLAPEYRPLSSPALKPERHSNSQRHVLERRRRKELAVAGATAGSQERE